jgi:uncharacterized small protein (DUF1192 family)
MTLGALILLGLVVAEVATILKVNNLGERIEKLQEEITKKK